jgi:L-ascorbate metabolism protein UlaG (beta-lactamase superfamily)
MKATRVGAMLGFAAMVLSVSAAPVTVKWYGQSFFTLVSVSNTVVAIDPFDGTFLNYPIPQGLKADLLLVSHEHKDHNNVAAIQGDPLLLRSERGVTKEQKKGVNVRGISAYHDDRQGAEKGRDTIYTVEMEGLRFCHLGDLGQTSLAEEQLARIGSVDILFMPAGGHFTTEPKDLRKLIDQIKPRIVVPMHYKTAYTRDLPLAPLDVFLKLNPDLVAKKLESTDFSVGREQLPEKLQIWVPAVP